MKLRLFRKGLLSAYGLFSWLLPWMVLSMVNPVRAAEPAERIPLPALRIPGMPVLQPMGITAGGQRLLLNHLPDVRVAFDAETGTLRSNRPGWYFINYPVERITGLEGDTPALKLHRLLGHSPEEVRNWYFITPGDPVAELPAPDGPAPIDLTPNPTLVVDVHHPGADDANPGTPEAPLATIQAAIDRADPGDVIRVHPGIYRESLDIQKSGTRDRPIVIEGLRDDDGNMPVISGNDPVPEDAWELFPLTEGLSHKADLFTGHMGMVLVDGKPLREVDGLWDLQSGSVFFNWSSQEFPAAQEDFRDAIVRPKVSPRDGESYRSLAWRTVETDAEGMIDFGAVFGPDAANAVLYGVADLYYDPPEELQPHVMRGGAVVPGGFRGSRYIGRGPQVQPNRYAVWVDDRKVLGALFSTHAHNLSYAARHHRFYVQDGDRIDDFQLQPGWSTLYFIWDTSTRPGDLRFGFRLPARLIAESHPDRDDARPGSREALPYIAMYRVAGPAPVTPTTASVFLRLPGDRHPRDTVSFPARGRESLVRIGRKQQLRDAPLAERWHPADFIHFRGFEIRGGGFCSRPARALDVFGSSRVEGCRFGENESFAIFVRNMSGLHADPAVVRNNWIVNPGSVGIASQATSDFLTADNQDVEAPGRGRILIEHNFIRGANWLGSPHLWEGGGMKFFRLTDSVIRYNHVTDSPTQGIWLDYQHYQNRLEGNRIERCTYFGIGIEASPGPHLIANNLIVGMTISGPQNVWFRHGILSWNSSWNFAVNNTIDGRWNPTPGWQNMQGTSGMALGMNKGYDKAPWQAHKATDAYVNNLVVGCSHVARWRAFGDWDDYVWENNYTDRGRNGIALDAEPPFLDPRSMDYRLPSDNPLLRAGSRPRFLDEIPDHMYRYDYFGLLRFLEEDMGVGAFRAWPADLSETRIEIDLYDGGMERR